MRKNVFVELVYQAAHANRPSTDFVVLRSDVKAYIPAVMNFALTKGFYTQKNEEKNGDIPTQFYQKIKLTVQQGTNFKKTPFVTIPKLLVALPSNRSLRMVIDNCDNLWTPFNDIQLSNIDYWCKVLPDEKLYRLEAKNIFLYNKPALVTEISVTSLVDASELSDTDELSLPAGSEPDAITMCSELVLGIRTLQVDRKVDARNIN